MCSPTKRDVMHEMHAHRTDANATDADKVCIDAMKLVIHDSSRGCPACAMFMQKVPVDKSVFTLFCSEYEPVVDLVLSACIHCAHCGAVAALSAVSCINQASGIHFPVALPDCKAAIFCNVKMAARWCITPAITVLFYLMHI